MEPGNPTFYPVGTQDLLQSAIEQPSGLDSVAKLQWHSSSHSSQTSYEESMELHLYVCPPAVIYKLAICRVSMGTELSLPQPNRSTGNDLIHDV